MNFWFAFAAGAVVLWLFARDQFNHPSWNDDRRLTRILSVPHLRGERVRKRALAVYLLLLLCVYAVFVFLLSVGVVAFDQASASPDAVAGGATVAQLVLPGASVPLAVSLAMVGIAPRVEILTRLEQKIRVAAHEMMGLPRGLFTAGQRIADTELALEQIGRENIVRDDLDRLERHLAAAREVFGKEAVKVKLFERRLVKLLAFKTWVLDGVWPGAPVREPYEVLETELATEMNATLADLDAIASVSPQAMSSGERDALLKRWDDRMKVTEGLCGEICALLFIYSEKEDPGERANVDPVRASIAAFFGRAGPPPPDVDILLISIVAATAIAAVWGYVSTALSPVLGLPQGGNPAEAAVTFGLSALFLYGPALVAAVWLHGRADRVRFSTRAALWTFVVCLVASLMFLVALNVAATAISPGFSRAQAPSVLYWAFRREAPMATLGAVQGIFVLLYLDLEHRPEAEVGRRKWTLLLLNVLTLLLLAVVATQLIVPTGGREPTPIDFAFRVPIAGIMALTIGLVMISALAKGPSRRPAPSLQQAGT
jgi:hypothetical protein